MVCDMDPAQYALANVLAPIASKDALVHDSYLCQTKLIKGSKQAAFPTQRISGENFTLSRTRNFVGNNKRFATIAIDCPEECRPQDHKNWKWC